MFVGGGESHSIEIFEPFSGGWASIALPKPTLMMQPVAVGNSVLFIDAESPSSASDTIVAYDVSTGNWTSFHLGSQRSQLALVGAGSRAIAFGGNTPEVPATSAETPRFALLQATRVVDASPAARLTTEADWTFPALDAAARAVDIEGVGPAQAWKLHVQLQPLPQATQTAASGSAPAVTRNGVSLWLDGVSEQADGGLLVQVAGRAGADQTVAGIGVFGSHDPSLSRLLWDSDGHQYRDTDKICCPMTNRTEGNVFYQDLTFQDLSPGGRRQFVEVPFVLVRQRLARATMTLPVADYTAGHRMELNTTLALDGDSLDIVAVTLENRGLDAEGLPQRLLLLEFDFGGLARWAAAGPSARDLPERASC